jgi:hypothetical protein
MIQYDQSRRGDSRNRSTVPAPSSDLLASPEVAAFVRASERVRLALLEQAECIAALRALDSRHPGVSL